MDSQKLDIHTLAKMAMCLAVICVSAYITFPLPFTPAMISASTAAMCLTALVLTPRQTFLTILAYLLLGGVAGLPILPGGAGGMGRLLGPTGGFYFAWLFTYPIVSALKGNAICFKRYCMVSIIVSIPLVYVGGMISMMLNLDLSIEAAIVQAVLPFIPGDLFKCVVSSFIAVKVNKALGR